MTETNILKKCPFCGGEAKIIPYKYANGFVIEHQAEYGENTPLCPIGNDEGEGTGVIYYETEQEAMQAWNKRVYPEQTKVSEWILCSERLPETNVDVRVSAGLFVTDMIITVARMFECEGKKCWNIKAPVYAWQPLPEDYQS